MISHLPVTSNLEVRIRVTRQWLSGFAGTAALPESTAYNMLRVAKPQVQTPVSTLETLSTCPTPDALRPADPGQGQPRP